jgi:predicted esterase
VNFHTPFLCSEALLSSINSARPKQRIFQLQGDGVLKIMRFINRFFSIPHWVFAFALFATLSSQAAGPDNVLRTYTLTPPIPVSRYNANYVEDATGQTTYTVTVNGQARSYQIYAPSRGSNDRPRPAILLLHGSQRSGVSLVEKWKAIADRDDIILIGPHGLNKGWSMEADGPAFFNAVLEDANTHHKIDRTRLYLFGHSLGANYALYLSVLYSGVFAATALHAGQFNAAADYALVAQAQRKIPVAIFVGTQDPLFPLYQVRQSAQSFASQGHVAALYVLSGHNHWYYDIAPFVNQQAWDFLSQYSLGNP